MASRVDSWRRRIASGLERAPRAANPGQSLLASVVGEPSPELTRILAEPGREAAVLIGVIDRPREPTVLLTERSSDLPHHAGQISLPGGGLAAGEDPVTAALREAEEEVDLKRRDVDVLGRLSPQLTGTGFTVTPVVGWVSQGFEARPDPAEVASAFEVPLTHFLDPANRHTGTRERWGTRLVSYEFRYAGHRVWGATAAILTRFVEVING